MDITNILFIVVIVIITVVFIVSMWLFLKRLQGFRDVASDDKSALLLQNQMQELTRTLQQQTASSSKLLQDQFIEISKITRDTTEKLARLDETNRQVLQFSEQIKNLQDILKNPKQRGVLGEYYLETILKNVLPPDTFQMQYSFKDGTMVDAVVFVKDKIIPIDSKFSLENYNRLSEEKNAAERARLEKAFVADLKQRIVETAKYIRPEEGTMDFAFMFIPHEAIYYDLLVNKVGAVLEETESLIQRAAGKYHVVIVSPTSFHAYLQTVLQGLRAMHIEETAKEIRSNVEKLNKHIQSYHQYHEKLGTQLGTVVNTYNVASSEFKKIDKDVVKITGEKRQLLESSTVEKPKV